MLLLAHAADLGAKPRALGFGGRQCGLQKFDARPHLAESDVLFSNGLLEPRVLAGGQIELFLKLHARRTGPVRQGLGLLADRRGFRRCERVFEKFDLVLGVVERHAPLGVALQQTRVFGGQQIDVFLKSAARGGDFARQAGHTLVGRFGRRR